MLHSSWSPLLPWAKVCYYKVIEIIKSYIILNSSLPYATETNKEGRMFIISKMIHGVNDFNSPPKEKKTGIKTI